MKKNGAQIHNELVDRVMREKYEIDTAQKDGTPISDYQVGWYDALSDILKWIEDEE